MTAFFYLNPIEWFINATGKLEEPETPEVDDQTRRETFCDVVMECDPSCCQSEFGAYALMAMFPREM